MKITPPQALANLYQAARLASLTAEQHEMIVESAKTLQAAITPKEESKPGAKPTE